MKTLLIVIIKFKLSCALSNVNIFTLEMNFLDKYNNSCHSEKDRFQFMLQTSVTQCFNECGARQHCQALKFWGRMNLCELFSTFEEEQLSGEDCLYVKKADIHITKTPCQPECKYGEVCESMVPGQGVCKVKECVNVPVLENGAVLGNRRDLGAVIRYKCDYGYKINGSTVAKCLDNGKWSTHAKCVKDCVSAPVLENGAVLGNGRDVGAVIRYKCDNGYKINGSTVANCLDNGKWSTHAKCIKVALFEPDLVSPWYEMNAKEDDSTLISVAHGLGETPLLVDVQVKVTSGDNAGYIFPATGCPPRDDDDPEGYGGIVYIYNDECIKISSPKKNNHFLGRCVYTGILPYWDGPYSTDSYTAQVRVRAWKKSSLPAPSYSETGIPIIGGNSAGSYVEKSHGLGSYPTLVISRTKFPSSTATYPDYYSDSVGAAFSMYDGNKFRSNSYLVYGYNDSTIKAWASSAVHTGIFDGRDGWNFISVTNGELELYAWDETLLSPTETGSLTLGQSVPGSNLEQSFSSIGGVDDSFTRAWVQASGGPNSGYLFIGSGSLAYATRAMAAGCTYGGLLYAYGEGSIRYWQPGTGNGNSNGAVICIPDKMGGGINVQASSDGQALYSSWKLIAGKK